MDDNGPRGAKLAPTSADATGEDFTDALGRRWIAVEEVVLREINVAEREKERRNADDSPPPEPDPRTLSREDLAEKLRPRRLVGDYEYRLEEPDYEVADRILAMEEPPHTNGWEGSANAFAPRFVITGDRQRVQNPSVFPGSLNARLQDQGCTATMIGPSTAHSAAHCFYNGGWIASRIITFGANTVEPTAPFGSFLADSLTIPGAWDVAPSSPGGGWDWDFAVLEFSPSRPDIGRQTGWHGTIQNFNGGKTMVGYPLDKPPSVGRGVLDKGRNIHGSSGGPL